MTLTLCQRLDPVRREISERPQFSTSRSFLHGLTALHVPITRCETAESPTSPVDLALS